MDWFRSYHGAPADAKWISVTKRAVTHCNACNAEIVTSHVVAVWWTLMDFASQQEDRGSVIGFDAESVADFLGIDEAMVTAILQALDDKGLVSGGRLTNWDKRQPKREDDSTDRVRNYRARKKESVTQGNAAKRDVTQSNARGEEIRGEEKQQLQHPRRVRAADTADAAFDAAWATYPARSGGNPRKAAAKAWRARVASGVDPGDLTRATAHYAEHIRATRKERTEYVMQGATFYGPNERWREFLDAVPPPSRNGTGHGPREPWGVVIPGVDP